MATDTPVTLYSRFVTFASGVAVTTEAGAKHLTASLEIAKQLDGGIALLINGAVVGHFDQLQCQRIESLIHGNVS